MSRVDLSICIPTHNFGAFIGETLKSILSQATEHVEIVIVDGASTDNTADVVEQARRSFPRLRFHRREVNMGVDADLAKAVDMAEGRYCWLMSSDDVIVPRAVERMLDELQSEHDVYVCNRIECDRDLRPVRQRPWLGPTSRDQVFRFARSADFVTYFAEARSLGALFSYISSIVVRRDKWMAVTHAEELDGCHYAHAFRLFSLLRANGSLKYIRAPLVLCRGDNDSFAESGMLARIALDLDGFTALAARLFDERPVLDALKAVMRREHPWYDLAGLRSRTRDARTWNELERKLRAYGYSPGQLYVVNAVARSSLILPMARWLRQTLRRTEAAAFKLTRRLRAPG
jgi:O-antigen biosynthesis alpha-1,3-abequosyltransferase